MADAGMTSGLAPNGAVMIDLGYAPVAVTVANEDRGNPGHYTFAYLFSDADSIGSPTVATPEIPSQPVEVQPLGSRTMPAPQTGGKNPAALVIFNIGNTTLKVNKLS